MNNYLIEELHLVKGLDPVADAFSATVTSDIINLAAYNQVAFIVYKGVGATGTATLTVEPCSNAAGSVIGAPIPFKYRRVTTGDVQGPLLDAPAAGFATTAGSSQIYAVEVTAADLALSGYNFVRLKSVELVDAPVLGGILVITGQARYDVHPTAIA